MNYVFSNKLFNMFDIHSKLNKSFFKGSYDAFKIFSFILVLHYVQ